MGPISLGTRIRTQLHRRRLDTELASGADPYANALRRERARELVGMKFRGDLASGLEQVLAETDPTSPFLSTKVWAAQNSVREAREDIETVVERLKAPGYISPQAVATVSLLLTDGASSLYEEDATRPHELRQILAKVVEALDQGPTLPD